MSDGTVSGPSRRPVRSHFLAGTLPDVIHKQGKGDHQVPRSALVVDNSAGAVGAASKQGYSGQHGWSATCGSRSRFGNPRRVVRRSPDPQGAPAATPERTSPYEGRCTSSAPGRHLAAKKGGAMQSFEELTHFLGFDWASEHPDVCVLDRFGALRPPVPFRGQRRGLGDVPPEDAGGECHRRGRRDLSAVRSWTA